MRVCDASHAPIQCNVIMLAAYIEQIEDGFLLQYAALHLGGQLP